MGELKTDQQPRLSEAVDEAQAEAARGVAPLHIAETVAEDRAVDEEPASTTATDGGKQPRGRREKHDSLGEDLRPARIKEVVSTMRRVRRSGAGSALGRLSLSRR